MRPAAGGGLTIAVLSYHVVNRPLYIVGTFLAHAEKVHARRAEVLALVRTRAARLCHTHARGNVHAA